jgi:hypothetical protein
MYGTSEVNADASKPAYVAGITDNVRLTKTSFENSKQDKTGKDVLMFTFTAPNGSEFRKIFWDIDPERVAKLNQDYPSNHTRNNEKRGYVKGERKTDAQAIEIAYDEFNRQIKHILTKYLSEEEATIKNINSYKDFAMQIVKKLTGKTENKLMRLKTVYNKKGYLEIPRFGNYLESMETSPSELFLTEHDTITRNVPSKESDIEESFVNAPENDMPF